MSRRWYVIRTKPQCEYIASDGLERRGLESFLPCVQTPRPRHGHSDLPLFPGYLFLRCDPEKHGWPSIHMLKGVLGWVRFGTEVPSVADQIIEDLASRVAHIDGSGGLWDRFRPGQKVRVVSGKVDGLAEVVESAKSPQSRVRVLMEFLGHQVKVEVPWESLRRSPEHFPAMERSPGRRRTRGKGRWIRGFGPRADSVAARA